MIPIVLEGISAASQVASPATKRVAALATILGLGVLAGGAIWMWKIFQKPVIDFNSEGPSELDYTSDFEFSEPAETRHQPRPKQYVFVAPPQARPPISNNSWLPSQEFDREMESRFYNCL